MHITISNIVEQGLVRKGSAESADFWKSLNKTCKYRKLFNHISVIAEPVNSNSSEAPGLKSFQKKAQGIHRE